MKKTFCILLLLFVFLQSKSQIATNHIFVSSYYNDVITKNGIIISVKAIRGKNSNDNATLFWQIKNTTSTPIFLEGNFKATGKPISGTFSNGEPAGKNKSGGSMPESKVNANSTEEFQTPAEWINDVDAVTVTLDAIHKGSNIQSDNGN